MTSKLLCFKCKKNPPNYCNKQDKVCKTCFLEMTTHRFKSSLRQNLKIWKDDLNLVAVSGGSHSMGMLNLLFQSLFNNQSTRKMFFSVHILYIDEGRAVYGHSEEQRQKTLDFIKQTCKSYKFTLTIIPLERVFDISPDIDLKNTDEEASQKIEEEKKMDEETHSQPVNFEEFADKEVEVLDIESKRAKLV